MCRLRIRGRFFNLSIINAHSPHLGSADDDKENFYTQLEREYDRCPQHDVKIVIGDFNAQVGREEVYKPTIGSSSTHQLTNDNRLRLVNFASSKHMTIRSTFFQHAPRFSYTWRSPQQTYSQIDHVLIDGRHFSDIIDIRTYRGANVDSDHFLVMVKLRQKLSVANKLRYQPTPRLNTDRLRQADVARDLAIALEEALPEDTTTEAKSLNNHWRIVGQAISSTAERTIGRVTRNQRKEWFDDECRRALSEKNAARTRMLQRETRQNVENYKRLRRQQTRLFQEKKRSFEESDEQLMQQLSQSGETRQFYRMLNAARSGFTPMIAMCRNVKGDILSDEREVIDRWKCYFDGHLNGADTANTGRGTGSRIEQQYGSQHDEDEVSPPSLGEVISAVKQLTCNKSAGSDGLVAELFKMGPERLAVIMHRLTLRIWDQEELPDEWKLGVIHPISSETTRLGLLETNRPPTLRQILQKCREHQIPTHHLFIDFKAAYGTIDRTELWNTMQLYGFPGKLVRLLRATMDGVQCKMRVSNMLSESFESHRGFADDIDIIGRTSAAVCEAYTLLKREAARIGLRINATKTKYLLAGGSDGDRTRLGSRVSVDGDDLGVVEEFCYLGTIAAQTPAIQKAPATHEMHDIPHTDTSGSPLWP
ncbi:uncharacterized protein LOC128310418 [Anopheles moucheti]|uniref:uncharacterized protein LOC128310418 n=1 Tax=Anopheles moucheti TaxID=186751 RepID=UPI0022F0A971|nr:uncharacterized protein LOC128310418 [Anopheles moucheti]